MNQETEPLKHQSASTNNLREGGNPQEKYEAPEGPDVSRQPLVVPDESPLPQKPYPQKDVESVEEKKSVVLPQTPIDRSIEPDSHKLTYDFYKCPPSLEDCEHHMKCSRVGIRK